MAWCNVSHRNRIFWSPDSYVSCALQDKQWLNENMDKFWMYLKDTWFKKKLNSVIRYLPVLEVKYCTRYKAYTNTQLYWMIMPQRFPQKLPYPKKVHLKLLLSKPRGDGLFVHKGFVCDYFLSHRSLISPLLLPRYRKELGVSDATCSGTGFFSPLGAKCTNLGFILRIENSTPSFFGWHFFLLLKKFSSKAVQCHDCPSPGFSVTNFLDSSSNFIAKSLVTFGQMLTINDNCSHWLTTDQHCSQWSITDQCCSQ